MNELRGAFYSDLEECEWQQIMRKRSVKQRSA